MCFHELLGRPLHLGLPREAAGRGKTLLSCAHKVLAQQARRPPVGMLLPPPEEQDEQEG